jgi:hypothetical protein
VWCFEGAGGDSTWPANPAGGTWKHWSRFAPPIPAVSRWHVTTQYGGALGGTFNAWLGCDASGTTPGCSDVPFWTNAGGYGNDWNYALELQCAGQDASAGGTIEFDLRYDAECVYDYLYLEYFHNATSTWKIVLDGSGTAAVFNGVSENPVTGCDSGGGGTTDGNYFDTGVTTTGGGAFYGNSTWYENVVFPLPAQSGDTKLRWRGISDVAFSDQDGRANTDGLAAVDNVTVTFAAGGAVVSDDFESGDFTGAAASAGTATWVPSPLIGNTYDGWHLAFDPMYKNEAASCFFDDTWMWAAKPDNNPIPSSANGFDFFLVSPSIDVSGWTGGVVTWKGYDCDGLLQNNNWSIVNVRAYENNAGWSTWQFESGFPNPCGWSDSQSKDLSEFLGTSVESLQVGWEFRDFSKPGDLTWGKHSGSQFLVDNVSFASYDGTGTVFTARSGIDFFADTFSLSDPAHTAFLANAEQGDWVGAGGSRQLSSNDSLNISVTDIDHLTLEDVVLAWRHDDGGTGFGAWQSKAMNFSVQDGTRPPGEGTYRTTLGADDGGTEDLTASGDGRVWKSGTTVEYYVTVTDDGSNVATYPAGAPAQALEFSVLPFDRTSPAQGDRTILVVDGFEREALDFESSSLFDPTGGFGLGNFEDPVYVESELLTRQALDDLGLVYDLYDLRGAGSSVSAPPRGRSDSAKGLGGYLTDAGTPYYDAILWLNGTFGSPGAPAMPDTTRFDLAQFLDGGGHLFVYGDDVGTDLSQYDPTFLSTYLGAAVESTMTTNRVLNVAGVASGSLDGVTLGLYGDCPSFRRFDRLLLGTPAPGSANSVLAEYASGGSGDDGLAAVIRNERTVNGGVAVLAAFDIDALVSTASRACVLSAVLGGEFGVPIPSPSPCTGSGISAPFAPISLGFALAAPEPSPFAAATTIRFAVPVRTAADVSIFDVTGRLVRRIEDRVVEPGVYRRSWDGRDDAGTRAAAGVYFVRMTAADFSATRKVVLLR